MKNDTCSQLLKEKEVAEYLGVSVKSLRRWRFDRRGLIMSKLLENLFAIHS